MTAQRASDTTANDITTRSASLMVISAANGSATGTAARPATWLPPRKSFRCDYVARPSAAKARYGLRVTRAEHDAMRRVLTTCPAQRVPSS